MRNTLLSFAVLSAVALAACQPGTEATPPAGTSPAQTVDDAAPAVPARTPAAAAPTDAVPVVDTDPRRVLAGKVWRVTQRSDEAAPGATYAFLEDGRLVVGDAKSTPMTGSWTVIDGMLSIVEGGITYPTGMVVTDADHVRLRYYNPAGVLDLSLERATDVPLPN